MEDERVLFKFLGALKRKWLLGALAVLGVLLIFFGAATSDKTADAQWNTSISNTEL